jgi:hypothetical protein
MAVLQLWPFLVLILPALASDLFPSPITINSIVTAGTLINVTVEVDLYNYNTYLVDSYRVYLATGTTQSTRDFGPDFFQAQCKR